MASPNRDASVRQTDFVLRKAFPATAAPSLRRVAIACPGIGHIARGYETFAREIFERIRDHVPATLFKGFGPETAQEHNIRCLRRTSASGRILRLFLSARGTYDIEAATFALGLHGELRRGDYDVAFITDYNVARLLARLRGWLPPPRRFAIVFHNSAPYGPRKVANFDLVQQVTFPSQDKAVAAGLGNTQLIPIPVDSDRFHPGRPKEELRRDLGLDSEAPVVLCAAAHEPFKRIELLIEAVARLPAADSKPPVLIVAGEEGARSRELRMAAKTQLGVRAILKRFEPDHMPELYRLATVFVLPSKREGFGRVLLEAMASGLPIVTHDDTVRRWVVGNAGVFVDCNQSREFVAVLARLLEDEAERERLGAAGRARALRCFSWPVLLPSYLSLLESAREAFLQNRPTS